VYIFRGLIILKESFFFFYTKIVKKPLMFVGRIFFIAVILNFYRAYLFFKKKLSFLSFTGGQILAPFTKSFLPHAVIIAIAFFVVMNNGAQAITQEPARTGNILSTIAGSYDDEETIIFEESVPTQAAAKSYLDQSAALRVAEKPTAEAGSPGPIVTQGGTALVTPNIPTMIGLGARSKIEYYTVQAGDTLSTIASSFQVSINTILWENKLGANTPIRPGQKLTILPVTGVSYKVAKGDTVAKIAKKYNSTIDEIIAFNKLVDASDISLGQVLIVPGGRITYVAPRATSLAAIKNPTIKGLGIGMLWPTISHRITQYFTWRHAAIDVGIKTGSAVYASDNGVVEYASWGAGGWGNTIVINHGNGIKTRYSHLSKFLVKVGDRVEKGENIALSGNTGRSTGPHLDYRIYVSGRAVNPFSYVR